VIAVRDYDKLQNMAKSCDEKKVYTKMYSETKTMLLKSDGGIEAEVYFETIEGSFKETEEACRKAKKTQEEITKRIEKERQPLVKGGELKKETKA
jgi:hypothetical protein